MSVLAQMDQRKAKLMGYAPTVEVEPEHDIATLVESQMRREGHLATFPISCECHDDVLILHGIVPTYYLKQVAQTVAMHAEGVERVDNQIMVGVTTAPDEVHRFDEREVPGGQRFRRRPR